MIVPKPGDAILGTPACQVPDCGRPSTYDDMCNAHRVRWIKAGRPDRRTWVATTDPVAAGFRPLAPCIVAGCRFSQHRDRLCYHHSYAWRRQGRPPSAQANTGSGSPHHTGESGYKESGEYPGGQPQNPISDRQYSTPATLGGLAGLRCGGVQEREVEIEAGTEQLDQ